MKPKTKQAPDREELRRLPAHVRQELCQMLHDGAIGAEVDQKLKSLGYAGATPPMVTYFRKTIYADWQAMEERIEAMRRDGVETAALMRHYCKEGGSPAEAGLLLAGNLLTGALRSLNPQYLHAALEEKPALILPITEKLAQICSMLGASKRGDDPEKPHSDTEKMRVLREIFGLPTEKQ